MNAWNKSYTGTIVAPHKSEGSIIVPFSHPQHVPVLTTSDKDAKLFVNFKNDSAVS